MTNYKQYTIIFLLSLLSVPTFAQNRSTNTFERTVFNHVGINIGAGLEGISIGFASPVTNFLEVEGGLDIMPGMLKINGDIDIPEQEVTITGEGSTSVIEIPDATVDARAKFSRTQFHLKANVYPFGSNTKFFIAAGISVGGKKLAKLSGHSEQLKQWTEQNYPQYKQQIIDQVSADLADYDVKFNDDFTISGDIRCNDFRTYLGLGFGRLVPKNRLGFRFELGCQFMGRLKVYQGDKQLSIDQMLKDVEVDDDISKLIQDWRWYPCLKMSIVYRIM